MTKEEMLRRDIKTLMEANRLAWLELAERSMPTADRREIREGIAERIEQMRPLFERLWVILDAHKLQAISERISKT